MVQPKGKKGEILSVDENLVRHIVLNNILSYKRKFGKDYGELVLCCDDKNYWRKDVFPYYKAGRKKAREDSKLNWNSIFESMNKIKEEMVEYFPYKLIQVPRAEADDIIGSIVSEFGDNEDSVLQTGEKILIISSDHDFVALQKYPNVYQWAPMQGKFLRTNDPKRTLMEHIMQGDRGDGVPNFLSPDDSFVSGKRQKPLTEKAMEKWMKTPVSDMGENARGYKRNEMLVDLSFTPDEIKQEAIRLYKTPAKCQTKQHIMNYMIKYRLKTLTDSIQDF